MTWRLATIAACAASSALCEPMAARAALHAQSSISTSAPTKSTGKRYRFTARFDSRAFMDGSFTMYEDSITVRVTGGFCRPVNPMPKKDALGESFRCDGGGQGPRDVVIAVSRTAPLRQSTWSGTADVQASARDECVVYNYDASGRQTGCAKNERRVITSDQRVGGPLEVREWQP